jgi:hypothetical protein
MIDAWLQKKQSMLNVKHQSQPGIAANVAKLPVLLRNSGHTYRRHG